MKMLKARWQGGILALALGVATAASAGPVILGGDDLTDHGFRDSAGNNFTGWLYIEKAVDNILNSPGLTRGGTFTTDIAALGVTAATPTSGLKAGRAISSATAALGLSVSFFDTDAGINSFFTGLANGTVNPRMLWLPGTGTSGDLDSNEGIALANNANAIDTYVGSGGGLLSHGDTPSISYGWLSALLPGLNAPGGCNSTGATLTPAGQSAFPGLSNADISSGPCHNHFTGDFGGLTTLAFDGDQRSFIIGASGVGGGSITQPPSQPPSGVPTPAPVFLFGAGLIAFGVARRARSQQH